MFRANIIEKIKTPILCSITFFPENLTFCLYVYLGIRITKYGNYEPEINDRINGGRAAISKLNSILRYREVTSKTKTHIYHTIVKSTITYAAETWCLKQKRLQN
jgi:hypothetical protein